MTVDLSRQWGSFITHKCSGREAGGKDMTYLEKIIGHLARLQLTAAA